VLGLFCAAGTPEQCHPCWLLILPADVCRLQLYMHLVSRTAQPSTSGAADPASSAQRNALLLNKSADIWTEPYAPADWWGAAPPAAPLHRRCRLVDGRWTVPLSDSD
jgi:hypothetical protein